MNDPVKEYPLISNYDDDNLYLIKPLSGSILLLVPIGAILFLYFKTPTPSMIGSSLIGFASVCLFVIIAFGFLPLWCYTRLLLCIRLTDSEVKIRRGIDWEGHDLSSVVGMTINGFPFQCSYCNRIVILKLRVNGHVKRKIYFIENRLGWGNFGPYLDQIESEVNSASASSQDPWRKPNDL